MSEKAAPGLLKLWIAVLAILLVRGFSTNTKAPYVAEFNKDPMGTVVKLGTGLIIVEGMIALWNGRRRGAYTLLAALAARLLFNLFTAGPVQTALESIVEIVVTGLLLSWAWKRLQ